MLTLLVILAVVAILFGAAVVATQDNQVLADAPPDDADLDLPAGRVVAEDLRAVRFAMVLRGYRMSEVDAVLDRLGEELAARDERIADLERVLAEIVEPVMDELEGEAQEPASPPLPAEVQEPASPPSLTPTLAQGARAGEAPAETPAPAPVAGEVSPAAAFALPAEAQEPPSPSSLTPTLAQGARAGEAPAETPAPAPVADEASPGARVAEEVSPAATFTLPAEAHSLRLPLVETPEPQAGQTEPDAGRTEPGAGQTEPELVEPFGAETLVEPEPEPEPEPEAESEAAAGVEAGRSDVPGVGEADQDFGFPEVLGADESYPVLPEATEDSERDPEVWRPAAQPQHERPDDGRTSA